MTGNPVSICPRRTSASSWINLADGADLNAIGSLVFEPTQGEDKYGVMTFQVKVLLFDLKLTSSNDSKKV